MYKKSHGYRTFWKTIVPLFTSKPSKSESFIINEGDKSISDETKTLSSTFFSNVMFNLDKSNPLNYFKEEKFHSLSAIIEHFEKHPSVSNIKNKNFKSIFSFKKAPLKKK